MLFHDRATGLAPRHTPEGCREMRTRTDPHDDHAGEIDRAAKSALVAALRTAIEVRDGEIAVLKAHVAAASDAMRALPFAPCHKPTSPFIALQARNVALAGAWKSEVAQADDAAATADRSWADAMMLSYMTEQRNNSGEWTTINESSSTISVSNPSAKTEDPKKASNFNVEGAGRGSIFGELGIQSPVTRNVGNPSGSNGTLTNPVAYPDAWQACHERCLQETDHIRGSERPALYRKCVRQCLGPDADY